MKFFKNALSFFLLLFLFNPHLVLAHQEKVKLHNKSIKAAAALVPLEYQKEVLENLKKAGRNFRQLIAAIENTSPEQREAIGFLIANMPRKDLKELKADFLVEDVRLAYQSLNESSWSKNISKDIFLNDVLPYASINEHRDNWRKDFHDRFIGLAQQAKNIDEAVVLLNRYVFDSLQVVYHATKRLKPEQSPYESMRAHYASCTGLSVLLTDALRSVGIPARIAGIALWPDQSGNHTWVEIWDGTWHYIGAGESTKLDHAWFTQRAAQTDLNHPIYATSFKKTGLFFPMRWALHQKTVFAVNVTEQYMKPKK